MANVKFTREELKQAKKRYDVIRDCLGGEIDVKAKATRYLPVPNAELSEVDSSTRYAAYLKRATFYNATKRTLDGLCGQIFAREPVIELPTELKLLRQDAAGSGVSLTQLAKEAVHYTLGYGRCGVFIDYPSTTSNVTREQIESGEIRPTLTLYAPWQVINWRTISRGARKLLSLVVLEETKDIETDNFVLTRRTQWRVLRLVDNVYRVELWDSENAAGPSSVVVPTDANGQPLNEIPFVFVGATNNDDKIDEAPLYDIAALNIAHYRNSADYEESCFMVGQPTPVFTGLTEDWVANVLKGCIRLGARGAVSLPVGGAATLLQASANTMPFEAMQHKEKQMVALGAKLVEQRAVVRTASEANIDHSTESSVLASAAKNVAAGFEVSLRWAARYAGASPDAITFSLNTDFDIANMSSEERRQLVEEWQSGGICWEEYRTNLRKSGIATLDDTEARARIDEEIALMPQPKATPNGTAS